MRLPEDRHAGLVAIAEEGGQPVEQQVGRAWRVRRGRRRSGGARHLGHAGARSGEGTREHRGGHRFEVRLPRDDRIERTEPPGGFDEQSRRVAAARGGEHRLGAEQVYLGALEIAEGSGLGGGEEPQRVVERAGLELAPRGGQGAPRALLDIRRHRGGALEKGRGRGEPAARLRASCGPLELGGDVFIGRRLRQRAVPGAAVGIGPGIGRARQRAMDLAAFV